MLALVFEQHCKLECDSKKMKEQIKIELKRLEQQHNIKILYAVESGSRA